MCFNFFRLKTQIRFIGSIGPVQSSGAVRPSTEAFVRQSPLAGRSGLLTERLHLGQFVGHLVRHLELVSMSLERE